MPLQITSMPTRRRLLTSAAALGGVVATGLPRAAAAQSVTSDAMRVGVPYGVQVGDVVGDRAVIWSKADRPARMMVRWSTTESMADSLSAPVVNAVEDRDFVGKVDLAGLPPGQRIFYEVSFLDLGDLKSTSEPVRGSFPTPPAERRDIRFVWSGDTAGQGWGINPDFGGMKIYEAIRQVEPDFFIHSGDTIYADGPILAEAQTADGKPWLGPDGKPWKNVTIPEKQKVAETLHEFRMNYAYNLIDENIRRLYAQVPLYMQWDDHEVTNNWYWELRKDQDKRYQEKSVARLAANAMRAFHDYMPTRLSPLEQDRIFTTFAYGPSLEVFRIDLRSYRGPNGEGKQTELSPEARVVGERQLGWLMQALADSKATWKVIACDMPIGLVVWDDGKNKKGTEAVAQGDMGPPLGRELEFADLFRFIRDRGIRNVVWLTADVHYTAAHRYDPNKAKFQEFAPFWEFVSGPLNAGTFGPNDLDGTFGPELVFAKTPEPGQANLPPSAGLQFFGQVDIDGKTDVMTVRLKDIAGATLFTQELTPEV
ncbi:MAG: alkaline phosphatase D family protein [Geminicoccaceae bacterium]